MNRLFFVRPSHALRLVTGGHEDGVVHRGPKLDGADADGGDEGQALAQVVGQAQVDKDGRLNDRDENEGQGGLFSTMAMMRKMAMMDTALTILKSWSVV